MALPLVVAPAARAVDTPFGNLTPRVAARFALSVALFGAAMHYLVAGRKEADLGKMAAGAVLALLSVFLL